MKKILSTALLLSSVTVSSFAASSQSPIYTKLTIDSLEKQGNADKSISWSGNFWIGNELNKVYLYSEGDKPKNSSSESQNQLVVSHAISPYWDVQLGIGYDEKIGNHQTWGIIGFQGMLPYFIETRAILLAGNNTIGLRLEAEYKALITQRLYLTPSLSTAFYSKDIPKIELGKGLSSITANLKLNYEITKQFIPYIGVQWSKNYGNTNNFSQLNETYLVGGFKFWF
ncbi:MAG: copper resistance protein B [Sulfurospirillum sp.]